MPTHWASADLIKRPNVLEQALLNPEFKGKASILKNIPIHPGIMDAAMVVEASGLHNIETRTLMTKAEIDLTMKIMTEAKKGSQFSFLERFQLKSVNLMINFRQETVTFSQCGRLPATKGCARWASLANSTIERGYRS
jgi:putative spermidine/putrescine transport system substrate-binding protein